jgi:hypothetical protein
MDAIWSELIKALPGTAAVIAVVVYFIRYIEKRDVQETKKSESFTVALSMFGDTITKLTEAITVVAKNQDSHNSEMRGAIQDMRSATRRRKDGSTNG